MVRRNKFIEELFMRIEKEHIIGVVLIPIVSLYLVLEYPPFSKANQTTEQKRSMPNIDYLHIATLYDIRFVELQIEAVNIDMDRYIGWFPDEKEMLKKSSTKAVDDLESIKRYILKFRFPDDLAKLKNMNSIIIDKLIIIYDGIELKEHGDLKKAFAGLNDIYSQYSEKLKEIITKDRSDVKLSENITFIKNTDPNGFDIEKRIILLSKILDAGEYSPVLFDTFCEWRTQTQLFWGGMSNMSEINNWKYNLKRWQIVQSIRQYLKANPDDMWAKAQVRLLLGLPNIDRGGYFGNDTLSHLNDSR